jgi:hypothetical protein
VAQPRDGTARSGAYASATGTALPGSIFVA